MIYITDDVEFCLLLLLSPLSVLLCRLLSTSSTTATTLSSSGELSPALLVIALLCPISAEFSTKFSNDRDCWASTAAGRNVVKK